MTLRIPFESEDFPVAQGVAASGELAVTWDDIIWAAITVGRPSRHYVFRHGMSSAYEALFRLSLVRSALEQSSFRNYRLRRTGAFKTLDPTEKGAVNYFVGMTLCKLFATKLLNTPWLLHIDVFGKTLGAVLRSRSRPDLVGQDTNRRWHSFECKGRAVPPDKLSKDKAKAQARRLESVNGQLCQLHIGSFTYFANDTLRFYWRDPPGEGKAIQLQHEELWGHYYGPFVETYQSYSSRTSPVSNQGAVPIEESDVSFEIHPALSGLLLTGNWAKAHETALGLSKNFSADGFQPDGLRVTAGPSWSKPFETEIVG